MSAAIAAALLASTTAANCSMSGVQRLSAGACTSLVWFQANRQTSRSLPRRREGVAVAKSDSDGLPLPPMLQRELDKLLTSQNDRLDRLNSARVSLSRGLAGLIKVVTQHPDPQIRKQGLRYVRQVAESTATIIEYAAKNPIADRARTISATKNRSALTPKIDEIIASEAKAVRQRHPDFSDNEIARQINKRVNELIAEAAAIAGVKKIQLGQRAIGVRLKKIPASSS